MSDLPQGWAVVQVQELFHSFSGGTPSKGNTAYWGGKIPWLSSGDIKAPQVATASESITRAGLDNSSSRLCRPGSVLVVVRSGILKHTLPVAILECEAAINQDLKCFDAGDDAINKWLALSLRASERDLLAMNREGTTVQSVKYETLKEHALPLPPLAEQRRIVAKLEDLLGKVDACRKRLAKIPVLLKRFRQSVLAAACSGRLTADWREENLHVIPAEAGIQGSGCPTGAFGHDGVPGPLAPEDLPEHWRWVKLPQTGEVSRGKSRHRPRNEPSLFGGPYPFIQTGDIAQSCGRITSHVQSYSEAGLAQSRLWPPGTICITIAANIAESAILTFPACFPDSVVGIIANPEVCEAEYVEFFIRVAKSDLATFAPATAQKNINIAILNEVTVPLPPLPEQHEIVRRVEALFALADQILARYAKTKAHVDRLTQSILAKAFRGELVPQDPNDEPASVLLERLRNECTAGDKVRGGRKPGVATRRSRV